MSIQILEIAMLIMLLLATLKVGYLWGEDKAKKQTWINARHEFESYQKRMGLSKAEIKS